MVIEVRAPEGAPLVMSAGRSAGIVGFDLLPQVVEAVADLIAQRALSPFQIPVGLVTSAIGGAYLVWLLVFSRHNSTHGPQR